jgi:hypothetical protein
VVATISEVEQVKALIEHLKREGELLAAQPDARYEVFVLIDNFDEFIEEISRDRSANTVGELAALARRYGRSGVHFIIGGTLDGNRTDFQRRIQASNLGLGLRTGQAISVLGVLQTPAAVRNGELPAGRGYIVRSGQPTMIQVALPAAEHNAAHTGAEDDEERLIHALDSWVQQLCARYPKQRATWIEPSPEQHAAGDTVTAQPDEKMLHMLALLQAGIRKELAHVQAHNGDEELLTSAMVQDTRFGHGYDEEALWEHLKRLWVREKVAQHSLPHEVAVVMLKDMDKKSLLLELDQLLLNGDNT